MKTMTKDGATLTQTRFTDLKGKDRDLFKVSKINERNGKIYSRYDVRVAKKCSEGELLELLIENNAKLETLFTELISI